MKRCFTIPLILFSMVLSSCMEVTHPVVLIRTEYGDIEVEIFHDRAPVTSANFLRYIDAGLYKDASFYRVIRPDNDTNMVKADLIQGGLGIDEKMRGSRLPAIRHETTKVTGISHLDGTISMMRNYPGTASSEFFFCVGDQPDLDYGGKRMTDGYGYAAFGKIIKGMDIVRKIYSLPSTGQNLDSQVRIFSITRIKGQ